METILSEFHFIRPWCFLAVIPSSILFYFLLQNFQRSSQWQSLIDSKLLPFLIEGQLSNQQKLPMIGIFVIWCLLIIAMAGPTWEKKPQPIQQDGSALVILWDLSPSMNAEDIKPSRLIRSRLKLVDLLDTRIEGVTALIAYAGDAHVVTPLTDDTKTIKSLLPGLSPGIMPQQGSNPEQALELAYELLKETGVIKGYIVFVTDEIAYSAHRQLSITAESNQHRITVWGIGTSEGAPIPLSNGRFAKKRNGEIVLVKVNHQGLSDAAISMNGTYIPFSNDDADIQSILHFGFEESMEKESDNKRLSDEWHEQGHWLILLILPFAALLFRRGWLLCFGFAVFLNPSPSYAFGWQDLWKTKDQQAQELLQNDQTEAAANTFSDPNWKAIADYKNGDYDEAISQFNQGDDAQSKYNLGNALTQQGDYEAATKAYDEALKAQPDFPEAEANQSIAKQLKAMAEQQQDQKQDGEENQEQSDQQDSQDQENQSSDQQSDGEQSDQEKESKDSKDSQEESSDEQSESSKKSDKEKQDALDKHYKDDEQDDPEEQSEEQSHSQQQEEQGSTEEEKEAAKKAEQEKEDTEQTGEPQQVPEKPELSEEEQEQQQALNQWLRRVPDDPSGLMRNKFEYEYNKRRRESFDRPMRSPDGQQNEERW